VLKEADMRFLGEAALKDIQDTYKGSPSLLEGHIRHTEIQVKLFISPPYTDGQVNYVRWVARGLQHLSEGIWTGRDLPYVYTLQDVVTSFQKRAAEGLAFEKEEFEEDPEAYRKHHKDTIISEDGPTHPWGSLYRLCTRWLEASGYEVWKVYEACRWTGEYTLADILIDMTQKGTFSCQGDLQESITRTFKTAMEKWEK